MKAVCAFILTTFSAVAFAAPPHGKATILHCGCAVDATGAATMVFVQISPSSTAKGHTKHGAGTTDTCTAADGTSVDFVRTGSDCKVTAPVGSVLDTLAPCVVAPGDVCGAPVVQQ